MDAAGEDARISAEIQKAEIEKLRTEHPEAGAVEGAKAMKDWTPETFGYDNFVDPKVLGIEAYDPAKHGK